MSDGRLHVMVLLIEVQMWELTEFVIPKIKDNWDNLAYCMRYTIGEVEAFKKESRDLKECCIQLFRNWITTGHGPTPKTYKTLLHHIKKINDLTAVSGEIERQLIEGIAKNSIMFFNTIMYPLLFYYSSTPVIIIANASKFVSNHHLARC